MSTSASLHPRADTPNDFREDISVDTPTDCHEDTSVDTPTDCHKDTPAATPNDHHDETPSTTPSTDPNTNTDADTDIDTQVVILVTPVPAPTPANPSSSPSNPDSETDRPPPPPLIALRRLLIPKKTLYTLLPPPHWTPSPITKTLGIPLKLARYPFSRGNKTPNPSMIGFSMLCDVSNPSDFGKVVWTKVLGAVVVAREDGAGLETGEFEAVVRFVNFVGEELAGVRERVEGGMRGWDVEMRERRRRRRREGEAGFGKGERGSVREALRAELVGEWVCGGRVGVEAFRRFREGLGREEGGGKENGGAEEVERVDEVVEGLKESRIV
ncbi:hypothetical protein EJ03DRAFT_354128 [Teratosphaeria nubilosa]|uniref:Uncharacterized protein n=1 Tax=Teratosphaeria nubilosa TaxID=161662 RepID=A0A6G1L1B0_9PEZI|nr:hypothetical protein EJ03DRAFT_354128 [Teratosphaeria nubilosa]